MPQQSASDKRGYVLVCHGPSCSQTHNGCLPGDAGDHLMNCALRTGPCLGMCPVGPNAIVRRTPIGDDRDSQHIDKDDSILCGIADVEDLLSLIKESLASDEPPRLLKGRATPKNLRR
jgi:hypothetical protein